MMSMDSRRLPTVRPHTGHVSNSPFGNTEGSPLRCLDDLRQAECPLGRPSPFLRRHVLNNRIQSVGSYSFVQGHVAGRRKLHEISAELDDPTKMPLRRENAQNPPFRERNIMLRL